MSPARSILAVSIILTVFAVIFTIALTFASIEFPGMIDSYLHKNMHYPDIVTGQNETSDHKTEIYLDHYNVRLIGYICLGLIVVLIIAGFITNKTGLSSLGAIAFFLPVFGHFAATMFFLGGLGFLRLIWMPFLDVSFEVMRLGDIAVLPYRIMLYIPSMVNINIWKQLPFIITGAGLFLFTLGTVAWFYAKIRKKAVADFWLYRISRHPQYLGWIIWSYGILFLPGNNMKMSFELSNSLPWLISTMVIIGVAMSEELKMRREQGEPYESFARSTPFLFPLPGIVSNIISSPMRLILKNSRPERKRDIASVLALYTGIFIVLSLLYGNIGAVSGIKNRFAKQDTAQQIEELAAQFKASERREAFNYAQDLVEIGEPAVDTFLMFLNDETPYIREFSAQALGKIKSERAIVPLIGLINDENSRISNTAIYALVELNAQEALYPLIEAINNPDNTSRYAIASALGNLGSEAAVEPLIESLKNSEGYDLIAHIEALGRIRSEKAVVPLIDMLHNENERVRRAAMLALMNINSSLAVPALTEALNDEDWEVRLYAKEALKFF
ncbi:HEAT repeat domain-containing protein [Candidatus Latescibacterota bacterium]